MNYVGLDYSIKSPAMCIIDGDIVHRDGKFNIDKCCKFFNYCEPKKKYKNIKWVENLYKDVQNNKWDVEKYNIMSLYICCPETARAVHPLHSAGSNETPPNPTGSSDHV